MEKKVLIFQGGWSGHEPQLTSKRFAISDIFTVFAIM